MESKRDSRFDLNYAVHWKIKGPGGAAELLGVKSSTLLARMKKWGCMRPGKGVSI